MSFWHGIVSTHTSDLPKPLTRHPGQHCCHCFHCCERSILSGKEKLFKQTYTWKSNFPLDLKTGGPTHCCHGILIHFSYWISFSSDMFKGFLGTKRPVQIINSFFIGIQLHFDLASPRPCCCFWANNNGLSVVFWIIAPLYNRSTLEVRSRFDSQTKLIVP